MKSNLLKAKFLISLNAFSVTLVNKTILKKEKNAWNAKRINRAIVISLIVSGDNKENDSCWLRDEFEEPNNLPNKGSFKH